MDLGLANKVAIVTGASRGIGKSITEHLISHGCKVAMISRNIHDLELIKNKINSNQILCFETDIKDTNAVQNIVHSVYDNWGEINILINNAGITKDKIILRLSEDDWQEVIDINLKGYYNTIKSVSKYMIKNKHGKIINISSVIGQIGNIGQSNYAASKAGIEGMTRALAVELGSRNINVNCIAPGYIETNMTNQLDEKVLNNMKQNIPLNKLGSVEDISNLVCYLASDLSLYITGQVINVDGGMTIK
tara:strand:+ start:286 stop:1029 length:744 start_codon:yes stop_codon:yes gene_type:complete